MERDRYIRENYKRKPLIELAKDLEMDYCDLALKLRQDGLIDDINPYDINYVLNNLENMSLNDIAKKLGLTNNQTANIVKKFGKAKRIKHVSEYTEDEVVKKFKYIIEEKIGEKVNDTLAYDISSKKVQNFEGGHALLKWANIEKDKHPIYKYFSALAYLFNLAYPEKFRPYQFNHTKKTKSYFTRKRYLGELLYIIENKMGISRENIAFLVNVNGFLNNQQLNFYGLASLHLDLFGTKEKMINALLEHINQDDVKKESFESTYKLKEKLDNEGINSNKCFCKWCNKNDDVEIHHMCNKKDRFGLNLNIDDVENLIPLCKYHHNMVRTMTLDNFKLENKEEWRNITLNYILKCETDSCN